MKTTTFTNVDEYIAMFTDDVQRKLQQLRDTIKSVAPQADETISYQMPAYKQNGALVYFAAYKKHIGFYPTGIGISNFKDEIVAYKSSKGAIQFPLDEPLPLSLVKKIVAFKVKDNIARKAKKV